MYKPSSCLALMRFHNSQESWPSPPVSFSTKCSARTEAYGHCQSGGAPFPLAPSSHFSMPCSSPFFSQPTYSAAVAHIAILVSILFPSFSWLPSASFFPPLKPLSYHAASWLDKHHRLTYSEVFQPLIMVTDAAGD